MLALLLEVRLSRMPWPGCYYTQGRASRYTVHPEVAGDHSGGSKEQSCFTTLPKRDLVLPLIWLSQSSTAATVTVPRYRFAWPERASRSYRVLPRRSALTQVTERPVTRARREVRSTCSKVVEVKIHVCRWRRRARETMLRGGATYCSQRIETIADKACHHCRQDYYHCHLLDW